MIERYRITHLIPARENTYALQTCHSEQRQWLAPVIAYAAIEPEAGTEPVWVPRVASVRADGMPKYDLDDEVLIVPGESEALDRRLWFAHFAAGSPAARMIGSGGRLVRA